MKFVRTNYVDSKVRPAQIENLSWVWPGPGRKLNDFNYWPGFYQRPENTNYEAYKMVQTPNKKNKKTLWEGGENAPIDYKVRSSLR